jgi:hypothetical protein
MGNMFRNMRVNLQSEWDASVLARERVNLKFHCYRYMAMYSMHANHQMKKRETKRNQYSARKDGHPNPTMGISKVDFLSIIEASIGG